MRQWRALMPSAAWAGLVGQRPPVQSLAGPSSSPSALPAQPALRCPGKCWLCSDLPVCPLAAKGHRPQGPSLARQGPKLGGTAAASALGLPSGQFGPSRLWMSSPEAGGGGLLNTHCVPVRCWAPRLLTTLCALTGQEQPHGSFTTGCRPLPASRPWGRDKSWGSAPACPRAVPAETRLGRPCPGQPAPPPAQSRPGLPSSASAPQQGPSRGTCCVGKPWLPAPCTDLLRTLQCCAPCVRTASLDAPGGHTRVS